MYLTRALDIIDHSILIVTDQTSSDELYALMRGSTPVCNVIALITGDGRLEGVLDYPLKVAPGPGQSLKPYATQPRHTFGPDESVGKIVSFMLSQGHERVAVATSRNFVGLITRSSVISAYAELVAS